MTAVVTPEFLQAYGKQKQGLPGAKLPWLNQVRESALERVRAEGFPGPRDEAWKYTNVRPILEKGAAALPPLTLSLKELDSYLWGLGSAPRVVLLNGAWSAELSQLQALPQGVRVLPLSQHFEDPVVKRYLDAKQTNAFASLNTAFFRDGVLVHVAKGVTLSQPIHVLSVLGSEKGYGIGESRLLVVAEENSHSILVESYQGKGAGQYLCNAVTQYFVEAGATVDRYALQAHPLESFHLSTSSFHLEKGSHLRSVNFAFGAQTAREEIEVNFKAPHGEVELDGLYVGSGNQHRDQFLLINHNHPYCKSRQFFKGVLDGHARGAFTGKVFVAPDAQKTDAEQSNMNLLLSDDAEADTRPQLEIYADDVKCSHGATIGQLDEEALFYLRSRGIEPGEARHLLTQGFAEDVISRVHLEPLATYLAPYLMHWLNDSLRAKK